MKYSTMRYPYCGNTVQYKIGSFDKVARRKEMKYLYLRKASVAILILIILLVPIASLAESYYYDRTTETRIYLPSGWHEYDSDSSAFSRCFSDGTLHVVGNSLYYYGGNTAVTIPRSYRIGARDGVGGFLFPVVTKYYPIEMYSEMFEQPEENISFVSIKGVSYARIDEYKSLKPSEKKNASGLNISFHDDTVWYVCVIKNTVYIFRFANTTTTAPGSSSTYFENKCIPQYEQILEKIQYKQVEALKKVGIVIGVVILVAIVISIILKVEKKREKASEQITSSATETKEAEAAGKKHSPTGDESHYPTQSVINAPPESKSTTVEHLIIPESYSIKGSSEKERILYCRKCGKRLLPDSVYCDSCGTKIVSF